jgi:hypothetical protein
MVNIAGIASPTGVGGQATLGPVVAKGTVNG